MDKTVWPLKIREWNTFVLICNLKSLARNFLEEKASLSWTSSFVLVNPKVHSLVPDKIFLKKKKNFLTSYVVIDLVASNVDGFRFLSFTASISQTKQEFGRKIVTQIH